MNAGDLYILNEESPQEIQQGVEQFKQRCTSILHAVFARPIDVQRDFTNWFDEWVKSTADPALILHDEPLYVVARYLKLDPNTLSSNVLDLAEKLAIRENWY
jgi:hypothetical protein